MIAPGSLLNWAYFKNWERILEIFGYACRCFSKIQLRGCFCQLRFRWGNPSYEVTFHHWTLLQSKPALQSSMHRQWISKHLQAFAGILNMLLEQSNSGTSGGYIIKFISAGFCRLERICFTIKVTTQIHSLTQHTQRPMKIYEILKTFLDLLILQFKNKICLMMTSSKVGSKPVEICGVLSTCLKSSKDNETEITTQEASKILSRHPITSHYLAIFWIATF